MPAYLIVFVGAGLGGALRYGVNIAALRWLGSGLPYGTLIVNIVGSLVMAGDVNAPDPWLAQHEAAPQRRNPLTVLRAQRRLA